MQLAGFPLIINKFVKENKAAWGGNWANQANYPLDGYALIVELYLKDKNSVGVCVSKTSDLIVDSSKDYTCFSVAYDSSQLQPLT